MFSKRGPQLTTAKPQNKKPKRKGGENMKNERGITLIALVITIIVMLILVTVTIRVATDGNLFTHASNAVKDTKTAIRGENALSEGNVGDKTIEEIVAEQTSESSTPAATLIHFTFNQTEYTAEEGMKWVQWVDSRYNTAGFYIDGNNVKTSVGQNVAIFDPGYGKAQVGPNEIINDGDEYIL